MWNYVYYSLHMDSIDTSDHNAIQKYVYGLVSQYIHLYHMLTKANTIMNFILLWFILSFR